MLHNIMFNMAHHTQSCYMREACVRAYLLLPVTVCVILPLRWTTTPTPYKQVLIWSIMMFLDRCRHINVYVLGTFWSFIDLTTLKIKYVRSAFYDPGLIAWNSFRSCWQWRDGVDRSCWLWHWYWLSLGCLSCYLAFTQLTFPLNCAC